MTLVRHYKLNDNAASTTVVATVGTNGTLAGGDNTSVKATTGPGGTITYAFDMNGTDDAVNIQEYDAADSTAYSVSMWVNLDSVTNQYVMGRAASSYRWIRVTSSTVIRISASVDDADFTVPTLSTGTWYHIFATRTAANSGRLWINGTESVTGAISAGGNFTVNALARYSGAFTNGRIAEFRMWNSDESANVATWYAEGVSAAGNKLHMPFVNRKVFQPIKRASVR